MRYVWVKSKRVFIVYPAVRMCEVKVQCGWPQPSCGTTRRADRNPHAAYQVFTREPAPVLAYQGVSIGAKRYMRLFRTWTFWPGTVAMWIRTTIPKAGEDTGGNLVLLGTVTMSGTSHGYALEHGHRSLRPF